MEITVNKIPSPTWNWLRMNDLKTESFSGHAGKREIVTTLPEALGEREDFSLDLKTGMGEEFAKEAKTAAGNVLSLSMPESVENVRTEIKYNIEDGIFNNLELIAGKNSSSIVIMRYQGENSGEAGIQTRFRVDDGAELTLVQIQETKNGTFNNDIGGKVGENGKFRLIQLIVGGHDNRFGSFVSLEGKKAEFDSYMGYELGGSDSLDINTVSDHTGRKTKANINASGVLRGNSKKLFRGTIDFHRGCAGSKGDEMESVLLMDDDVDNKTIPVILCDEEDVEGNHGASIGKIDEDLMFYLKSRGMTEEAIYEMMAKAKIDSVIAKIPDEETRKALLK